MFLPRVFPLMVILRGIFFGYMLGHALISDHLREQIKKADATPVIHRKSNT